MCLWVFGITEGVVNAVVVPDTALAGVLRQEKGLSHQGQTTDGLHHQLLHIHV